MEPTITITPQHSLSPQTEAPLPPQRHIIRRIIIVIILLLVVATAAFFIIRIVSHANLENTVKSELIKQNKLLKSSAVNKIYKQTLPPTIKSTDKVKIDAKVAATGVSYCIAATSVSDAKVIYHMNETTPEDTPATGDCNSDATTTASIPTDVSVSSTGTTDVTLAWSASLYATGYTVQCATDENFTAELHSQTTTDLSKKIENLSSNTPYYCRVAATNKQGQSVWSVTVQARTNLYSQPPGNISSAIVSSSELSYSFDPVPGAEYYMLQYTTDINFMNNVTTTRIDSTKGTIKGLLPYTGYFIRVEAVTSDFDQTHAAYSNPTFARTKKAE